MNYSERTQNLAICIIQCLFKKKFDVQLDNSSAVSFSNLGLPSEVCDLYQKKYRKNKDIKKTLLLLRMESIKYLNKLKFQNNVLKKTNPLKYFFLSLFGSSKDYKSIKNKIIKEFDDSRNKIIMEKRKSKSIKSTLDTKVNSFNANSFLSSIKSFNDEIYKLSKSNPKKAEKLAKLINQKFKSLERIFINK